MQFSDAVDALTSMKKKKSFHLGLVVGCCALVIIIFFFILPLSSSLSSYRSHRLLVVIRPTFTFAAYQPHGFYDYYRGNCKTRCLTVPLSPRERTSVMDYAGSNNALEMIKSLETSDVVTDEQVTKNPSILASYQKVIVLHNEYVTQAEFDAITRHPDVLYLYPNALYALVSYNPVSNTITLQKGHGYKGVNDAFNWPPSRSTKDEYNTSCKNWQFEKAVNGIVLNCYPEFDILHDAKLWIAIINRKV
ncbi:N,N-dimethylformamidase beta subunit family domain-containing protein [Candidatus Nitrososphaera evergladensis]|uniref:N,N-dimethylformamidase beta subunit family domain-containing protein n=1 Tax=Candidatus Nitrososphaera evergladensis TaxID=1459637 RepID=UPI00130E8AED|nr:N,N-dimethylformamidase beta subunit family domain-containing protein [Candidatus Nitrososphaera evergladensis]